MSSLRKYEGNLKAMFNNFTPTNLAQQTIQIDETKEDFLRMLNEEFSRNGLYFELQEKEFEFKGLVPSLDIPDINLKFRGRSEKIGFLDPRNKTLVHFSERNIETLQEQVITLKRTVLRLQQLVKQNEEEVQRKKWNIFIRLFKKRSIIRLEVEARRMLNEIEEMKFRLQTRQSEIDFEQTIRDGVLELAEHMKDFGVKTQAI